MLEVFVAFTKESDIRELEATMEAWNLDGLEPVAIQVKANKFELHRRVTAESVSVGNYILTPIGYGPVVVVPSDDFGALAEELLSQRPDVGMWFPYPDRKVAICRKGIVTHWPTPSTADYLEEHIRAYELRGYKAIGCQTILCRPLVASLPS